jgi:hypothetical protein
VLVHQSDGSQGLEVKKYPTLWSSPHIEREKEKKEEIAKANGE